MNTVIRVEYMFKGRHEYSLYPVQFYTLIEARLDVLKKFPLAYITAAYFEA